MKLSSKEVDQLKEIAEWLNMDTQALLYKLVVNQIEYCKQIKDECWQRNNNKGKYELAEMLKLLD